jgi:hypothetical protein
MTRRLECIADETGGLLAGKSTSQVFPSFNLRYLLGLMNSSLIDFYFRTIYGGNALQGGYLRIGPPQLKEIPVRRLDPANAGDMSAQDRMVRLVDSMLALHRQLASAKSEAQRGAIQRQIEATDAEIDRLVYDLYGLTKDEIAIVQGEQ